MPTSRSVMEHELPGIVYSVKCQKAGCGHIFDLPAIFMIGVTAGAEALECSLNAATFPPRSQPQSRSELAQKR
jgi:hypothetical protein